MRLLFLQPRNLVKYRDITVVDVINLFLLLLTKYVSLMKGKLKLMGKHRGKRNDRREKSTGKRNFDELKVIVQFKMIHFSINASLFIRT